MKPPVIAGARLVLRPVRESDRDDRRAHGWHAGIERGYGEVRGTGSMTHDEAQQWYADALAMEADPACLPWVVDHEDGCVGVAFLHSLRVQDERARFAVGFFSPEHLGRGWGTEVTSLVLDHAFDVLGLHRVDLRVLAFNERAVACYERCGFVVEGRERDSCRIGDVWYDDVIMGILADDHRARR